MPEPFVIFEKPTVCMEFSVWEEDTAAVPAAEFLSNGEESGLLMKPVSGTEEEAWSADLACETGAVIDMMGSQVTLSLTR